MNRNSKPETEFDDIHIGAGIAGLTAMRTIAPAGVGAAQSVLAHRYAGR